MPPPREPPPLTCQVITLLAPAPPEPPPPPPPRPTGLRGLLGRVRPGTSPELPPTALPLPIAVRTVPTRFSVDVVADPDYPALQVMRLPGLPPTALGPEERRAWEDLVEEHWGVDPRTYVVLAYFPLVPDMEKAETRLDLGRLELQVLLEPGIFPPREMILLRDLASCALVRITRPLPGLPGAGPRWTGCAPS